MRRAIVLAVVMSFVMSFAVAAPVAAQVPNDTVASAIDVSIGTTVTEDTTEATTDGEAGLNDAFCGAPAMEAGVWFEITEAADMTASLTPKNPTTARGSSSSKAIRLMDSHKRADRVR